MNLIQESDAPTFDAGDTSVTAYAAPSRGADQISLWRLHLAPKSTSPLHHMDCEEIFYGLEGTAVVSIDGEHCNLTPGDCLVLPAGTAFTLHVPGDEPFHAVACIPSGGQATMADSGATFTPPWTE